ncbi:MAG: hypothetical protein RLZZ197_127 [Bacteroidota bacterium]|jgi:quinol monooxygenase YgiN
MKKVLLTSALVILCLFAKAQSIQVKDLAGSVGSWQGNLTYLDYSSGKPFTMLANIKISLTADSRGYIMAYEYPKEPHANAKDTTAIVGSFFGKDKIVEFKRDSAEGFTLVTEVDGEDGNENKKAILRHQYLLQKNTFTITKSVKFQGTDNWIKRNEYLLSRDKMYRIAKIKVDVNQLEKYKSALQEQMDAAIKLEPGVLSYTAVSDKKDPSVITIFEVYASPEAYQAHTSASHFKKYKETVKDMVLSLELIDTELVVRAEKEDY